jgi:hypothetical protein
MNDELILIKLSNFNTYLLKNLVYAKLKQEKNIEILKKEGKYYFIYIDSHERIKLKIKNIDTYSLKSYIKNGLNFPFSDKTKLYDFFSDKDGQQYFPRNIIVNKQTPEKEISDFIKEQKYVILKPGGNHSHGQGIFISPFNPSREKENIEYMKEKISFLPVDAILSRYLFDALLYKYKKEKYKFHIRYYVIVVCTAKITRICFAKYGEIVTAKKPYEEDNYEDKDIHGTNTRYIDLVYPDELRNYNLQQNIENMNKIIFSGLLNYFSGYENEADVCYDVLGLDIMVDKQMNPYILEINQRVSYSKLKDPKKENIIHGSLCKSIVSSIFSDEKEDDYFKELFYVTK